MKRWFEGVTKLSVLFHGGEGEERGGSATGSAAFVSHNIEIGSNNLAYCQPNNHEAGDEDMLAVWLVGFGGLRVLPALLAARWLLPRRWSLAHALDA